MLDPEPPRERKEDSADEHEGCDRADYYHRPTGHAFAVRDEEKRRR